MYEPAAKVHHRVPAERSTFAYFTRRCRAEGQSKALVARLVGQGAALASERGYAARVLPLGVARNMVRAAFDADGVLAAFSIVAGIGACGGSYDAPLARPGAFVTRPSDRLAEVGEGVMVVDVDGQIPAVPETGPFGTLCLVRRAGIPLCTVELTPGEAPLDSEDLARRINGHVMRGTDHAVGGRASTTDEEAASASSRVTVVVATRDPTRLAGGVPRHSRRCTTRQPGTIVVIRAPSDGRARTAAIRRLQAEDPTLTMREGVPGLASAHNAVLPHVDTPLIAFTDDDVIVDLAVGWTTSRMRLTRLLTWRA